MSGLPFIARALFDYDAVETTELSLTTGDTVSIEEVNESGWSLARLISSVLQQPTADRVGWIPTEYIEKVGVDGDAAAIAVGRPQPLSDSQPIQMNDTTEQPPLAQAATAKVVPVAVEAVEDVEEEVAALTITTAPAPAAAVPAPLTHPTVIPTSASAASQPAAAPVPIVVSAATAATPPALPAPAATKVCAHCHESIRSAFVMARDQLFHPNHFLCHTCRTPLGGKPYLEHGGHFYCEADYYEQFNPRCATCHVVVKGAYIAALDAAYHPHCFTCAHCHAPFSDNSYRQHAGLPYCEEHFAALCAPACATCSAPITGAVFEALDRKYHLDCFVCAEGRHPIGEHTLFHVHEGAVYCPEHFEARFLHACCGCRRAIKGQYVKVGDEMYHAECWQCADCNAVLRVDNCAQLDDKFVCKQCAADRRKAASSLAQLAASGPASSRSSRAPSAVSSPLPPRQATLAPAAVLSPILAPAPVSPGHGAADVVPLMAAAASQGQAEYVEPGGGLVVAYAALKGTEARPAGVDPRRKEGYLGAEEFVGVFGMQRGEFEKMPAWKRNEHKKRVGLF